MDPLRKLPFVSHILDRHVGGKALGTALILGDANIADLFIERYSNTLNYWGRFESYEIEKKAKLLLIESELKKGK